VSINRVGCEILQDENLDAGGLVSNYIPGYRFDADYNRFEAEVHYGAQKRFLSLTQYPIDERERDTTKLLILTDVTQTHMLQELEKVQLLEKSNIDQLTGLYNKQYLLGKFKAHTENAGVTALIFIDVDDFKSINDTYGHLVGDEVLRALAACIKGNVRATNAAIRFGGDEFVILLEHTHAEDAFLVAERIRTCTNALEFSGAESVFHITLSIGLIDGIAPLDELLEKADRAMYISKNKGKNKTTVFRESEEDSAFHMSLA
ncbi:MAG: GGDEF domain-containing protein, partial [Clostridiaceae bacterium]